MQKINLLSVALVVLLAPFLCSAYVSRVETELNVDFDSVVPAPLNCPYGAPKLPNDTLVAFRVGAIVDQYGKVDPTGPYAVLGWNLAFQKMNTLAKNINSPFFFTLQIQDTRGEPAVALQQIRALYDMGIRVILGPTSSEELAAVQPFVQQNGVVLISPTSSSNELGKKDSVYRVSLNDAVVASAYASFAAQSGFKTVLVGARNDSYGQSFLKSFTQAFNGTTVPFTYSDATFNATEITMSLNNATTSLGNSSFGVLFISFDEWSAIVSAAFAYPKLRSATWFGPNTLVSTAFPTLFTFANQTKVLALLPSVSPHNDIYTALLSTLKTINTAQQPFELFYAYDSALLAIYSFLAPETDKSPYYERSLLATSKRLFLSTGQVALDENGDRVPTSDFVVYRLKVETFTPLKYDWTSVGTISNGNLQTNY